MSNPPDLSGLIPSKWKTYTAIVGTGLSFIVPFILEASEGLPAPWPAVIGAVLWVLTALGVYAVPYAPPGTVIAPAPASAVESRAVDAPTSKPRHPWK